MDSDLHVWKKTSSSISDHSKFSNVLEDVVQALTIKKLQSSNSSQHPSQSPAQNSAHSSMYNSEEVSGGNSPEKRTPFSDTNLNNLICSSEMED